ncbi:heme-binding Shp domain-containing protein [Anaerosphaera multitolerans]|uniref:ABC transporter n=1 Tax=Anaerosphaera multitolerans TaxID=2487351 RepID=A0A437S5W2_9FIRM|nr:heme-binding Shp domain-containing protein [Anaerosphaera multitolerans]RVU54423.1 ABC transporter [Anaerosphaera multitolerans]
MKKIIMIIILLLMCFPLEVLGSGLETASANPYYEHPITGTIEDAGNNPGIGQGMTENVLHHQALFENVNGQLYVTVRYNLANFIENVSIAVQNKGDDDFYLVDYDIPKNTSETCDYRFPIPEKDAIVRSTFYVGPMGRDVVFYYNFTDFKSGNTDFAIIGSSKDSIENSLGNNSSKNLEENTIHQSKNISETDNNIRTNDLEEKMFLYGKKVEVNPVNSKMSAGDLGYSHGLLTKNSEELKRIYDSDMKEVKNSGEDINQIKWGPITSFIFKVCISILGGTAFLLLLMASGIYIVANYFKKKNEFREEQLYE